MVRDLISRYALVCTGMGILLVALWVNLSARSKRPNLGRVVILFSVTAITRLSSLALMALGVGVQTWVQYLGIASEALQAYTLISLVSLALFHLALPLLSVNLVSISSDLVVGIAYIVATGGVLASAGVNTSSVVATSAILSGILALSLQATLGNVLGGVALQIDESIHVGDWIQLENGRQGEVKAIRWRHTVLETRDWDTVIVPNASLLSSNILILGKSDRSPGRRAHRMTVNFNVDFRYPPSQVIAAVIESLHTGPIAGVATTPEASVVSLDFAHEGRDSYGYYAVRYFLLDLLHDDLTSSLVRERIHSGLRRAKIPLARPSTTVFITPEDEQSEARKGERHLGRQLSAVKAMELFKSLTEEEQRQLAGALILAPFVAGEVIARQGAVSEDLYLLVRGQVEVRFMNEKHEERLVASFSAPNFFGEMGVVTGAPRSAGVVATTDVETYRLGRQSFETLIKDRPQIAQELAVTLARRQVELFAARDGLDAAGRRGHEAQERQRILERIQSFLGLER